ncbi:SgcJ/EcaC family oxidoreductase [Spirosoma pollinicola]|uniref:DUF4440 domain-containing protein n=1 Tax=Spirosoma pollinicola TaxID=2057025 RepID=A0A2K8Z069_9BACT|nr:SgcJ/EcaC family oxidoreductase [Spirosoma pollinicola]AUD03290.1 hypothetical protein CWM47_16490 [Spirosoma pollinicola]
MQVALLIKITLVSTVMLFTRQVYAQTKSDTAAIQAILQDETTSWNNGDAVAYSKQFAQGGTFTNIMGAFFTGHATFLERHDQIFKTVFSKTTMRQKVVSLKFIRPNVAVVETLSWISGLMKGPPPGTSLDAKGRLVTRLLQVIAQETDGWKIVSYHNVDVKAGVPMPEPD